MLMQIVAALMMNKMAGKLMIKSYLSELTYLLDQTTKQHCLFHLPNLVGCYILILNIDFPEYIFYNELEAKIKITHKSTAIQKDKV